MTDATINAPFSAAADRDRFSLIETLAAIAACYRWAQEFRRVYARSGPVVLTRSLEDGPFA